MGSTVFDSLFFGGAYGTPELRALFEDEAIVQNWLDIESALAQTQGEMGIIPKEAADEIAAKAKVENLNIPELAAEAARIFQYMVVTTRALGNICENGAGQYVHLGATTQDIIDTGFMLSIKRGFNIIYRDLLAAEDELLRLIQEYRDTPMAGRSHTQQGLPITFGYKCANWASELQRGLDRMDDCRKRCFVGEMHGAMGTMAGFGPRGLEVSQVTIQRLGLDNPDIAWHTSRDRMAEICQVLSIVCCTLGRMGNELAKLQMTEIFEVAEAFGDGEISSSTMPHKRNPNTLEGLQTLARLIKGEAASAQESMFCEHERDGALWKVEWKTVNECLLLAGASAAKAVKMLRGLQVFPERMRENLFLARGLMMSERMMMALGKKIGKQTAHAVIYKVAMQTFEQKAQFRDMLLADPTVSANLSEAEIDELMEPSTYTGLAGEICDQVVASIREARARSASTLHPDCAVKVSASDAVDHALSMGWSGM